MFTKEISDLQKTHKPQANAHKQAGNGGITKHAVPALQKKKPEGPNIQVAQRISKDADLINLDTLKLAQCSIHYDRLRRIQDGKPLPADAGYAYDPADSDALTERIEKIERLEVRRGALERKLGSVGGLEPLFAPIRAEAIDADVYNEVHNLRGAIQNGTDLPAMTIRMQGATNWVGTIMNRKQKWEEAFLPMAKRMKNYTVAADDEVSGFATALYGRDRVALDETIRPLSELIDTEVAAKIGDVNDKGEADEADDENPKGLDADSKRLTKTIFEDLVSRNAIKVNANSIYRSEFETEPFDFGAEWTLEANDPRWESYCEKWVVHGHLRLVPQPSALPMQDGDELVTAPIGEMIDFGRSAVETKIVHVKPEAHKMDTGWSETVEKSLVEHKDTGKIKELCNEKADTLFGVEAREDLTSMHGIHALSAADRRKDVAWSNSALVKGKAWRDFYIGRVKTLIPEGPESSLWKSLASANDQCRQSEREAGIILHESLKNSVNKVPNALVPVRRNAVPKIIASSVITDNIISARSALLEAKVKGKPYYTNKLTTAGADSQHLRDSYAEAVTHVNG